MAQRFDRLCIGISQPFASLLVLYGLAKLGDALLEQQVGAQRHVRMSHRQTHYEVQFEPAIDLEFSHPFVPLLTLIETLKNKELLPSNGKRWDYDHLSLIHI